MNREISIIIDADGRKIVVINDVRFKGKKIAEWDEFTHGKDKTVLKGSNLKAKANITQVIGELIQIATNKSGAEDYGEKHGKKAKYGWYRYDTRLALPAYDFDGELLRYNIYKIRMLVRHDEDGKIYLYDFLRTKKEMSSPL